MPESMGMDVCDAGALAAEPTGGASRWVSGPPLRVVNGVVSAWVGRRQVTPKRFLGTLADDDEAFFAAALPLPLRTCKRPLVTSQSLTSRLHSSEARRPASRSTRIMACRAAVSCLAPPAFVFNMGQQALDFFGGVWVRFALCSRAP